MAENESSTQPRILADEQRQPSSMARLFPKVTFGLGAAVLTGVMVVTVPVAPVGASATSAPSQRITTTVGLGAVINAVAGSTAYETTCCGDKLQVCHPLVPS